jgi:Major Facilitator Superfamily
MQVLSLRRAAAAVAVLWFVNGLTTATVGTRLADIGALLGLGEGGLGLALLGQSLGLVLVVALVAPRLIARFGARPVAALAGVLYCASTAGPGAALGLAWLFLAFLVVGAFNAPLDMAMAELGGAVEEARGRPTMSSFEAMFVAGQVMGALAGFGLTELVDVRTHLALVALASTALVCLSWTWLPDVPRPRRVGHRRSGLMLTPRIAWLALVALAALWCEGAVVDWGVLLYRRELGAAGRLAVLGLLVFVGAVLLSLGLGGLLARRVGPVLVTRVGAVAFGAGMLVTVLAPSVWLATAGLAIAGLGLPNAHPLALSAARRLGGPAALATVQGVSYVGLVVAKPSIGFVAELSSLRVGLGTTVAFALLIALGAGALAAGEA